MFPEILNNENFYFLAAPHNLLSIYDSNFYRVNDLDFLDQKQREYLVNTLNSYAYNWQTGHTLISKAQKEIFKFPKTSRFRHDFNLKELKKERDENEIIVLTPTQMASYIIQNIEDPIIELEKLLEYQPVNIDKLRLYYERSAIAEKFQDILPKINQLQTETLKKQKIKSKKYI